MNKILSRLFRIISHIKICPFFKITLIGLIEGMYNLVTYFYRHRQTRKFLKSLDFIESEKSKKTTKDRIAIITGGSNGIGKELSVILLKVGYRVHVLARDIKRMKEMKRKFGKERYDFTFLDLSDTKSIQECAKNVIKLYQSNNKNETKIFDVLINNAGTYHNNLLIKDGVEYNLLVNHIGHYILTKELLPFVSRRIVNVSSSALFSVTKCFYQNNHTEPITYKNISQNYKKHGDFLMTKYSMSKLANALFTLHLKNTSTEGLSFVSVHPGMIASGLFDNVVYGRAVKILNLIFPYFLFTKLEGAIEIFKATMSDELSSSKQKLDLFVRGERSVLPKYINIKNAEKLIIYTEDVCKKLLIRFQNKN